MSTGLPPPSPLGPPGPGAPGGDAKRQNLARLVTGALASGAVSAGAYAVLRYVAPAHAAPAKILNSPAPPTTPRVKSACSQALSSIAGNFPTAVPDEEFLRRVSAELSKLGFKRNNCIALVNTCRDEVCRPIVNLIDGEYGISFNISGLGGLVNCGKTGFKAAMSHSPVPPCPSCGLGKERYIFFAFPHVSVGPTGEVGSLLRSGRGRPSNACGALIAIKNDITNGSTILEDADDEEYVLLKKKVMSKIGSFEAGGPSLVQTTNAAMAAITDDLEKLISLTVDPDKSDYAVITGVQIHSANPVPGDPFRIERTPDYIAPYKMYAVVKGQRYNLQVESKEGSNSK